MARECEECMGTGRYLADECEVCDGTGEVELEDIYPIVKEVDWAKCSDCGGQVAQVQRGRDIGIACRDCDNYTRGTI